MRGFFAALALMILAGIGSAQQNLGTVVVGNSGSGSVTFAAVSGSPTFRLAYGAEFQIGTASCSATCTVPVTFTPHSPGLKTDAVEMVSSGGTRVGYTVVYGIGQGAATSIFPALLSTAAGTGAWSNTGDGGAATSATFGNPSGIATDANGGVYISDSLNDNVRYVSATGIISTVAGTGLHGFSGDGNSAVAAQLDAPMGIAVDGAGNLYIADSGNNRIRRVDGFSHVITTVAGNGTAAFAGDGGLATAASLNAPSAVAVDVAGNLYIADTYNNCIRKVDSTGKISTIAGLGSGTLGGSSNPIPPSSIAIAQPGGLAVDAAGNLYIAMTQNHMVAELSSAGIWPIAGTGTPGYSGDGGTATSAELDGPTGLAIDPAGDVYISDANNSVVRVVTDGTIQTVAGNPGQFGYGGDGGSAVVSILNNPAFIAVRGSGLYIADQGNRRVRSLNLAGALVAFPSTIMGILSQPATLTVLDSGNAPLVISSATVGGNFVQQASGRADCAAGLTVALQNSCLVQLAFAPMSTGNLSANLQLADNSLPGSQSVPLSGTATSGPAPVVSVAPASLSFGAQAIGTIASAQTLTIRNAGSGALVLSSVLLVGSNAEDFSLTTSCGASVPANSSCTVSIAFSPRAAGSRTASLQVVDDAVGSPTNIAITGQGSAALPWVMAVPLPVFGTGLAANATLGAAGAPDPHWTIIAAADWTHPGPVAYAIQSAGLGTNWMANGPNSNWIGPVAAGSSNLAAGNYTYRTTFDLTGLDASTATLSGGIAADDSVVAVLNGIPVANFPSVGVAGLTSFSITSGFVSGTNTLDFVVTNATQSSTGLRVEISGTASRIGAVPIAVFGTGLLQSGSTAASASADSNYILETSPDSANPGPSAFVVTGPSGAVSNGSHSQWIAPSATGSSFAAGTYVYKTVFDLTGLNSATAQLAGAISAGSPVTLKLNGATVGTIPTTLTGMTAFSINSGFVSGLNILEFSGPAELQVQLTGTAIPIGTSQVGLFGTGVSASAALVTAGSADVHYSLENNGMRGSYGPAAYAAGTLPSGWAANGPSSQWLTPTTTASSNLAAGTYTFETLVDLSGFGDNPSVHGQLAATGAVTVLVNGVVVQSLTSVTPSALIPFSITSGFVSGVNSLEFAVTNSATGPVGLRVDANGTDQSMPGTGAIAFSQPNLTFSPVVVGAAAATQTLTLTNRGTSAVTIDSVFPNGPATSDYSVNTNCGGSIAAGATCTISVGFTPSGAGLRRAFLTITDTAGDSPQTIELTGIGAPARLAPLGVARKQ